MNSPKEKLESFLSQLREACEKCGRNFKEIEVVCVSKNHSHEEVNALLESGVKAIGENRLQEAKEKFPFLKECEKHFVGSIQSNKAKEIARIFDVVESVGSLKVARILSEEARKLGKNLPILLQVNLSKETQKSGFEEEELSEALDEIRKLKNLKVMGLMLMGVMKDEEKTREVFRKAKQLKEKFGLEKLSMGMSGDWEIALEEGSDVLRIGSLLF